MTDPCLSERWVPEKETLKRPGKIESPNKRKRVLILVQNCRSHSIAECGSNASP